jgi:hypothetical protein
MHSEIRAGALVLALGTVVCGCSARTEGASPQREASQMDLKADIDSALGARVFFAHHSVGANLLTGVETLARESGRELKLTDLDHADGASASNWTHSYGGQNGAPKTKIDHFVSVMRKGLKPDLAFMKFCFVDFGPDTDVAELFAYYQRAMTTLKQERPEVRFAHVTVPLMVNPSGLKSMIKRLIGRDGRQDLANVKRSEFNRRLVEAFPSDPIFDLARAESTRPDGTRETFDYGGKVYYSLAPAYTDDGAHLDARGQRALGAEMIRFVARAAKPAMAGSSP